MFSNLSFHIKPQMAATSSQPLAVLIRLIGETIHFREGKGPVMRRLIVAATVLLSVGSTAQGQGLLIPVDQKLPPLAVVQQKAVIQIDDQVAVTRIEQTFRNNTPRQLEATYVFPVPKAASVRKFSMWVGGKEETGELVEADKARKIYTDIVRRTLDPGLLEYLSNNLIRLRVFPVPPAGDQKISLTYTSVAAEEQWAG